MAADGRWHLTLFAGLRAERDGIALTRFRTEKTGALLAYLACRAGRQEPRQALVDLFWPGYSPEAGRNYLSKAISSLRDQLEPPAEKARRVIVADRAAIGLDADALTTDVAEFEAAIDAGWRAQADARAPLLERATALYRGEFLHGTHHEWVQGERVRLHRLFLEAAHRLFLDLHEARDTARALACARRTAAAAPLDEQARRDLMTALNATGDFGATIRELADLERRLDQELGVAPDRASRELAREAEVALSTRARQLRPTRGHEREPLFVGREVEIEAASRALEEGARIVTLLGPGGVGKTRLALEIAQRHADRFPGAVFFASMAELTNPALMPTAIRDAMRLQRSSQEPLAQVLQALSARATLLVLDNLEHVAGAGAKVIQTLVESAPGLRCLGTSRRRLALAASRDIEVRPLPVPRSATPRARLMELASVRLFVEQAQASHAGFALTDANAREVAALVRDLEGIPLALLLAASRMRLSSPGELRARLAERLDLLRDRRAAGHARHRTLRAAVSSNVDLLAPASRLLFARLSVFRGGFDLSAAERVCEDPLALDRLTDLEECSLVAVERSGEAARFHMLETIREYARELVPPEEGRALARRHAVHARAFVKEVLTAPGAALQRLERDLDNIRAALEWLRDDPDGDEGLIELSTRLWSFWASCGYATEGREWLALARARAGAGSAALADVRATEGTLLWSAGDYAAAGAALEESLALRRALGDRAGMARTLTRMGSVHGSKGDLPRAIACQEQSLALSREIGDRREIAIALGNLGNGLKAIGDFRRARAVIEESIGLLREQGERRNLNACLGSLGLIAAEQGDHAVARAYLTECLGMSREAGDSRATAHDLLSLGLVDAALGDARAAEANLSQALALFETLANKYGVASALLFLGRSATASGDLGAARGFLDRALRIFTEIASTSGAAVALQSLGTLCRVAGDATSARSSYEASLRRNRETREWPQLPETLEGLAALERADGRAEQAAMLLGAAGALREEIGVPVPPVSRKAHDELSAAIRADLGATPLAAAIARGKSLGASGAIALALGEGDAQLP